MAGPIPKSSAYSFRNALAKLRQAIGDQDADPPYLFITNDAIRFNRASDHKLDLERFTQLLAVSKSHTHRRIESCRSCSDRLRAGSRSVPGELFDSVSPLPDSDLFEDWLCIKREKYLRAALDACHQLESIY